jgi:thiol-disulfide isomerase/thioredoxin
MNQKVDLTKKTSEERSSAMTELAEKLKECGLGDASVKFIRETVCPMKAESMEEKMTLSVSKSYPPDR